MVRAEVGQIARGTVIRVLPYGALVRLDDGTLGLVHISEIENHFVHNVADHLAPGAPIVVKVVACKPDGKFEFSLKRARGEVVPDSPPLETQAPPEIDLSWSAKRETRAAFDEKLRDFLSDSGERLIDLKRHHDAKLHRRSR